jgi:hypothetical protein
MSVHNNELVTKMLKTKPETRNNDKLLILACWEDRGLHLTADQRAIFMSNKLPSFETISRTRRKLQADGQYLPNQRVAGARKQLAQDTKSQVIASNYTALPRSTDVPVEPEQAELFKVTRKFYEN